MSNSHNLSCWNKEPYACTLYTMDIWWSVFMQSAISKIVSMVVIIIYFKARWVDIAKKIAFSCLKCSVKSLKFFSLHHDYDDDYNMMIITVAIDINVN